MEAVKPAEDTATKAQGKPPPLPGECVTTAQKQTLFGGQLLGYRKHPSQGKVVINPLFVDDTDASNDDIHLRDKQSSAATPPVVHTRSRAHTHSGGSNRDHFVTVFTISNGEVTFQRKGSHKWFSDASMDDARLGGSCSLRIKSRLPRRNLSVSPDRKRTPSTSGRNSLDRKYTTLPLSGSQSDGPVRRYDREAILKKQSRAQGGKTTDYGFIDCEAGVVCAGRRVSAGSTDLPLGTAGSALTDDQKVAAQICNGSLHGTTSPEIILVHPNYQNSLHACSHDSSGVDVARAKSARTRELRANVRERRKVKACRLLGLTASMLIVIGLAVALVIYFAKREMVF